MRFLRLFMKQIHDEIDLLFEFHEKEMGGRHLRFTNPTKIITVNHINQVIPALYEVHKSVKKGYYAAGFVSYEAAPAFDSAYQTCSASEMPMLWFGLFETPEIIEIMPERFVACHYVDEINGLNTSKVIK